MRSLAAAARCSLFGHGGQHLADVGGQEVVHLVTLEEEETFRTLLFCLASFRQMKQKLSTFM